MIRELGRAGYRVVDADREAGFVLAERQIDAPDLLDVGRYAWDEVTLVVVPGREGLSEVQVTSSRSTQEPGEARTGSTAGLPSAAVAQPLLDACGGEITESG